MSELSQLIEINRNIEKQNEEIIRLLKKIAGEEEKTRQEEIPSLDEISKIILKDVKTTYDAEPVREEPAVSLPERDSEDFLLGNAHDVGEVCFIEEDDIFKLTVKNNETSVNNLTGDADSIDFNLQEMIANESIKNNQSLEDATVILNKSQSLKLHETLKVCYDEGAKHVYIPMSSVTQLIGAPDALLQALGLKYYRNDDELLEMLFGKVE
ncbi:hypothetical protein [Methanobrevibacter sp.]|uniref:hypothetical protein n=1 Tax=Methanobrevibacter sp. TaxID=66852 RepID=UPI00386A1448